MARPLTDLPPELLDLIIELLELQDLLNLRKTCRQLWYEYPLDKLKWLVQHMDAPTRVKKELASKCKPWMLNHALLILFRRHGLRRDLRILIEHGAEFRGVQSGMLLRDTYNRSGPGKQVFFLLENGVDFSQVPGGINQLLEDNTRLKRWRPEHACFLIENGALFSQVPSGCENLISDLIKPDDSRYSKFPHYLTERWKIYYVLERGLITYAPKNLGRHLIHVYNEFGLIERTEFLLRLIPNGLTLLIVHLVTDCAQYNWLKFDDGLLKLLRRRAFHNDELPVVPIDEEESEALYFLLKEPLDPVSDSSMIWEALMLWAASYNRVEVVETLVERKASTNGMDRDKRTPMLYAAFKGHAMVVKALLIAHGESTKVYEQENPLTIACAHRQEEVVEVLIRHGFSPNTCDGDGRAPLCVAALSGNEALVNLLLRHGADPNIETEPWEPIRLAYLHTADYALVNFRTVTAGGQRLTPLRAAEKHPGVIKILLDQGVDLDIDDILQCTSPF